MNRRKSHLRDDDKIIVHPLDLGLEATGVPLPESSPLVVDRLAYAASMTPNLAKYQQATLTVTDNSAFTINNPTKLFSGAVFILTIKNGTGGALGAITLGSKYKTAGAVVLPAAGMRRVYTFYYDPFDDLMVEQSRSSADVG